VLIFLNKLFLNFIYPNVKENFYQNIEDNNIFFIKKMMFNLKLPLLGLDKYLTKMNQIIEIEYVINV
jgi:hypothetical protein